MPPGRTSRPGQPFPSPRRPAAWARRRRRPVGTSPPRDWIQILVAALPGLAAIIALVFASLSVRATNSQLQETRQQLQTTEQGQITDRYNAAITNLGSSSVDVRLGGIYALQRIMQDSPRDQPTVVAVLCAFVRDHAKTATAKPPQMPGTSLPTDIQAALTVVTTRDTAHDGSATVVDFTSAHLDGAHLEQANLTGADLDGTDLTSADFLHANLTGANLDGTDLTSAYLEDANLTHAYLLEANLTSANLGSANLTSANLGSANLTSANLLLANLADARLNSANLTSAKLAAANFTGASLIGAHLDGAHLDGAKLIYVYLIGADLTRADLWKANLTDSLLLTAQTSRAQTSRAQTSPARTSPAPKGSQPELPGPPRPARHHRQHRTRAGRPLPHPTHRPVARSARRKNTGRPRQRAPSQVPVFGCVSAGLPGRREELRVTDARSSARGRSRYWASRSRIESSRCHRSQTIPGQYRPYSMKVARRVG